MTAGDYKLLPSENGPVCNDSNAPQCYGMRTFPTVHRVGCDCSMSLVTAAFNGPNVHHTDDRRMVVHWIRRLVVALSLRRIGFNSRTFHVGYGVDKVAMGQVFLRVLPLSAVSIVPQILLTHLATHHRRYIILEINTHHHDR
jgi:hypothetical protein